MALEHGQPGLGVHDPPVRLSPQQHVTVLLNLTHHCHSWREVRPPLPSRKFPTLNNIYLYIYIFIYSKHMYMYCELKAIQLF